MTEDERTAEAMARAYYQIYSDGGAVYVPAMLAAFRVARAREADELRAQVATLEQLRPQWAQGFSDDSIAAQVLTARYDKDQATIANLRGLLGEALEYIHQPDDAEAFSALRIKITAALDDSVADKGEGK